MELMREKTNELREGSLWVPSTPAKIVPARPDTEDSSSVINGSPVTHVEQDHALNQNDKKVKTEYSKAQSNEKVKPIIKSASPSVSTLSKRVYTRIKSRGSYKKKYRPKVVDEGKPKKPHEMRTSMPSTPKPCTPKPANREVSKKRVNKKGNSSPENTPKAFLETFQDVDVENSQLFDPSPKVSPHSSTEATGLTFLSDNRLEASGLIKLSILQRTCRRSLNFLTENDEGENRNDCNGPCATQQKVPNTAPLIVYRRRRFKTSQCLDSDIKSNLITKAYKKKRLKRVRTKFSRLITSLLAIGGQQGSEINLLRFALHEKDNRLGILKKRRVQKRRENMLSNVSSTKGIEGEGSCKNPIDSSEITERSLGSLSAEQRRAVDDPKSINVNSVPQVPTMRQIFTFDGPISSNMDFVPPSLTQADSSAVDNTKPVNVDLVPPVLARTQSSALEDHVLTNKRLVPSLSKQDKNLIVNYTRLVDENLVSTLSTLSKNTAVADLKLVNMDRVPLLPATKSRRIDESTPRLYRGVLNPRSAPPQKKLQKVLDDAIKQLERLHLDENRRQLVVKKQLVRGIKLKHGEVVVYPSKKKKLVPKVDIDHESEREFNQLMEVFRGGAEEERTEDRKTYWEQEREVFRGRVLFFIACMHLLLGDRRFSEWKGSVVDSVVGVFLTQNVSDHLSSSAFMSLASKFPIQSTTKDKTTSKEDVGDTTMNLKPVESFESEIFSIIPELELERGQYLRNDHPLERDDINETENGAQNKSITPQNNLERGQCLRNDQPIESNTIIKAENISTALELKLEGGRCSINDNFEQGNTIIEAKFGAENMSTAPGLMVERGQSSINGHRIQRNSIIEAENGAERVLIASELKLERCQCSLNNHPMEGDGIFQAENRADNTLILPELVMEKGQCSRNNHPTQGDSVLQAETAFVANKNEADKETATPIDWDDLRKTYGGCTESKTNGTKLDSVDWEAVRRATVDDVAEAIKMRGQHRILAERIKDFLDRIVKDHGSIDLEWLRNTPPDKAKAYLLSIKGLGLKSVECVRLLTLHHHAFPVDTNVARVAVRLGWVPLQPLPGSLHLHLLDQYPIMDKVQIYLWPRLCTLDQKTLYELHYQMITFGKVFCRKRKPNCAACPLKGKCRHYASKLSSARLSLPGAEEKRPSNEIVSISTVENSTTPNATAVQLLPSVASSWSRAQSDNYNVEPIIEYPPSPVPEPTENLIVDIEDLYCQTKNVDMDVAEDDIPTIRLDSQEVKERLLEVMSNNSFSIPDDHISKALFALTSEAAFFPAPKLKNAQRLRTVHHVYKLPDSHPILEGVEKRDPEDPSPFLFVMWPSDANVSRTESCRNQSNSQSFERCQDGVSSNNIADENLETVSGTLLIPVRTANRGSFPLNGTYFQVNEVFADDETSQRPVNVPRRRLWNLERGFLYCGGGITSICDDLSAAEVRYFFWNGWVCERAFNRKTRAPVLLPEKFHALTSAQGKRKSTEDY